MPTTDSDLYKDKIEVSLDGRQIFYLFFGGAVVACLVFVLGVMVGRRLEARGHVDKVAGTSAARDPLAALDKLADGPGSMTFPSALAGSGGPVAAVDREIAAMAARRDEPRPAAKPDVAKPDVAKLDAAAKPDVAAKPDAAAAKPDAAAAKPDAAKPAAKPDAAKPAAKPDAAKPAGKPEDKAKFTLQLSAFQDQAEAEAFLGTVKGAGYAAYVNTAEVDGKTFYRVRLGNYGSYDAAVAAKAEFERKVPKIAYVTRL